MSTPSPLVSLVNSGTKLWLDSVDPQLIDKNIAIGATGATSNPAIISDLIKSGRFDDTLKTIYGDLKDAEAVCWAMTDRFVSDAEEKFMSVFTKTGGNDGYVSFELDPLLEDKDCSLSPSAKADRYVDLGLKYSKGHPNRMIKVPATEGGLLALERLAEKKVPLNVTLIFSERQYLAAREAVWKGIQKQNDTTGYKSVFSIFVSRLDIYTESKVQDLSKDAQGQVGIVNAKKIWKLNKDFWSKKGLSCEQEMIFASTGVKKPEDPAYKYVKAFAGSDIETNPPGTNDAVEASGLIFEKEIDQLPSAEILEDIEKKVDFSLLEKTLMDEGLEKFAQPHKNLIKLIEEVANR
jgi:transaldolase